MSRGQAGLRGHRREHLNVDSEESFAKVFGRKRGTGSRVQPAGPVGPVGTPSRHIYRRQLTALAFPERHGPAILLFAGVFAWLGAGS